MADKLIEKHDSKLEYVVNYKHDTPNPRELQTPLEMKRVARPLRNIKHIPVKSLVFFSNHNPPQFSYETKISTPIASNKLAVQVQYVGLNPVDLKIYNGYRNNMNYEIGIGREYCGVLTEVGSKLTGQWEVGMEVCGTFWHPHLAKGTCESTILVDPAIDVIVSKPANLSAEQGAGTLYCLGAAFNILDKLDEKGKLNQESNILINGGTTMVGIFALQLIKFYYRIINKVTIVCSTKGMNLIKSALPELVDELLFIDYNATNGKIYKPLGDLVASNELVEYTDEGTFISHPFGQGSFNLVLDFVGGYDIIGHSSSILSSHSTYITTVGDSRSNYKKDVYNSWGSPSSNMRKLFGKMLWSINYQKFEFDPSRKYAINDWPAKCHELVESNVIKYIPIDKVYDWKEHEKAFKYLRTGHCHGKVVLKVEKF